MSQDNNAPAEEFDDVKADEYFNEFSGEEPVEPRDPQGQDEAAEGDEGQEGDGGEPPRDDQGRFTAEGDEGTEGEGDGEDPQAELERLRQEAQSWQHRYQSDLGRQNALQRKIQQLEQENQQLQKRGKPRQEPGQGESDNPEGSGMSDDEWKALKEDFPEIAKGVEQQMGAMQRQYEERIGQLEQQLSPIQEQAQEQAMRAQEQALEAQHPDWRETINTPDFQSWLNAQPPKVQELTASEEAADAAFLLQSYKLSQGGGTSSQGNSGLQQRRQRQLQSARTVPNRGGRQRSAIPDDDEDALFDYFANKD
ncbi:hypothetical protein M8009_13050 [Halomonas sp. ATCH28]|uniref:Uncharacterized protein n=1 Tax=Halomonas gemina TaxID=2945105 RepID=A0ABT0T2W3_9GAMM|nr:hypothetical protein [Halomonas gemina]MCL7941214.1 hypothetical protein [Halomonas gemina]